MMTPALRRFTFTTHIASSVDRVGAVLAFLALAVIAFTSVDPVKVRGGPLSAGALAAAARGRKCRPRPV